MENIQPLIISLIADIVISIIWPVFYSSIMKPRIKRWQYILLMVLIFMLLTPLQYIFSIPHIVTFILGIIVNIGGCCCIFKRKDCKKNYLWFDSIYLRHGSFFFILSYQITFNPRMAADFWRTIVV